jgi:protein phosphatase
VIDHGAESQPGPRPYNEDAYLIRDLQPFSERLGGMLVFMMVSDGMGGHQCGDIASRIAIETADRYVDSLIEGAGASVVSIDPSALLADIAAAADVAIVEEARKRDGASMGATFVAAFATAERAWVAHIGDSRAYLVRAGDARQLTTDHSQVGRMIADGVLTEEQAQHHPSRNVIERALGFGDGQGPDSTTVDLQKDDVLLLCSDGMSTVLTGGDLADIIGASANLSAAARALVGEAINLGSDDNTTVVVWGPRRSAKTISDRDNRGEEARRKARARRALQRHIRASRASYWIAGLLALVVIAMGAVALGGSSGAPVVSGSAIGASRGTDGGATSPPSSGVTMYVLQVSKFTPYLHQSLPASKNATDYLTESPLPPGLRVEKLETKGEWLKVLLPPAEISEGAAAGSVQLNKRGRSVRGTLRKVVGYILGECVTTTPPQR